MITPSSSQWQNYYPRSPDPDYRIDAEAERSAKKANNSLSDLSQHADPESRYAARELDDAADSAREAIDILQDSNKDLKERLAHAGELMESVTDQLSDVLAFFAAPFTQFSSKKDEEEFINWCRLFLKGNWEWHNIPESVYFHTKSPIRGFLLMDEESDRLLFKMRWD